MEIRVSRHRIVEKQRTWRIFATGLAVRLAGIVLIWLGDGHQDLFRKGLVVLGVILSVGGIGILRYLLISGLHKKLSRIDG